jgi:hypothetical protein
MMGRQTVDQSQLFYLFNLEEQIPADHLLRRLNPIVTRVLVDLREKLAPFYSRTPLDDGMPDLPWVALDDLHRCLGLNRDERRYRAKGCSKTSRSRGMIAFK